MQRNQQRKRTLKTFSMITKLNEKLYASPWTINFKQICKVYAYFSEELSWISNIFVISPRFFCVLGDSFLAPSIVQLVKLLKINRPPRYF